MPSQELIDFLQMCQTRTRSINQDIRTGLACESGGVVEAQEG